MIVACYKLERIPAAKSTNIKIIDVKADLKKVLVHWLDGWDHGKASDKITVQIGNFIIPYFSWMPGQSWCKSSVSKHSRIRLSSPFPVCASEDFGVQVRS